MQKNYHSVLFSTRKLTEDVSMQADHSLLQWKDKTRLCAVVFKFETQQKQETSRCLRNINHVSH